MQDSLRKVMLAAEGAGELSGESVLRGRAEHPICGDVLELTWQESGGVITALAFRAKGCPATLAVAAAGNRSLVGTTRADAAGNLRACLQKLGGLAGHEQHAAKMYLRALTDPSD